VTRVPTFTASGGSRPDLSFRGTAGDEESCTAHETTQCEIPRGVYPERQSEILRSAQNDERRAQDDSEGLGMKAEGSE
jgi:hypothetical protein